MSTRTVTRTSDEDEDSDEDAEGSDEGEYREGCTSMDKLVHL